jgi:phage tail-like protein
MRTQEIQNLLPQVIQRGIKAESLLAYLIQIMADYQGKSESNFNDFASLLDPFRTPDAFVPVLASWLDLEKLWIAHPERIQDIQYIPAFPTGIGQLRRLLALAMQLSQLRGTKAGLLGFLETATGITGFRIDENVNVKGESRPFHILVYIPAEAKQWRSFIERIIEHEKPLHLSFEIIEG